VPAVDELEAAGEHFAHRHARADAKVIVGDRPREQERARVVPVVFRLDHFSAGAGYEFAEIDLETFGLWRLQRNVSLLDIAQDARRVLRFAGVNDFERAAKSEVDAETHGIRAMFERELGHIQAELIGFHVEVSQAVGHGGRIIEILVRVDINEPAEIDRPYRPNRRWRRSWGRGRRGLACRSRWRLRKNAQGQRNTERGCLDTPIAYETHESSITLS